MKLFIDNLGTKCYAKFSIDVDTSNKFGAGFRASFGTKFVTDFSAVRKVF